MVQVTFRGICFSHVSVLSWLYNSVFYHFHMYVLQLIVATIFFLNVFRRNALIHCQNSARYLAFSPTGMDVCTRQS